jgi:hypothetical protein
MALTLAGFKAAEIARQLRSDEAAVRQNQVRGRDLVTGGTLTGADVGTQRVLNGLVSHEIQQRAQALEEAIRDLDAQGRRWPQGTAYAVADTSFYIEHDDKLRDLDFAPLLPGTGPDKPVTIIVAIIVLDELDGLKQRGSTRAREVARLLHARRLRRHLHPAQRPGHPAAASRRRDTRSSRHGHPLRHATPRHATPRHVRLPINDDEIIDRALAAQGLAGVPVTLLTFDTSQAARARHGGLAVNKLAKPLGEEPEDTRSKKTRQPAAGAQT